MRLIKYINAEFDEEKALYDAFREVVILKGDYYHDKIDETIKGFIYCLKYLDEKVELETIEINKSHPMFSELDFYSDED